MTRRARICILAVLAGLGTAFLVFGAVSGQASSVLVKAAHLCLECIGLG